MVRLSSTIALLLSIALGAEAAANCQCLFPDGSHCCAISKATGGSESCVDLCRPARRTSDNVACNADGKWSSVNGFSIQFRAGCNR